MLDSIERLFAHMAWADDRVQQALDAAPEPPGRAVNLYAHVLGAELVWLDRIEGRPQGVAVWPQVDVDGCRDLGQQARTRYAAFLETLTEADLARSIHYTNSAGRAFDTPLDEILLHVALHGAYHRGQVALVVRDAGDEPNPTDYIAYARGVPAATRADSERRG